MISTRDGIVVLVALIFLARPLAVLAGHDHDEGEDEQSWHDNGHHKGWYKHHHNHEGDDEGRLLCDQDGDQCRVCDQDTDDCHTVMREPLQPSRWDHDYVCDRDGDDCHWTGQGRVNYWRGFGGYDYGPPYSWYQAQPPSAYNLSQRRTWLVARRHSAMTTIKQMRERGDSKAAGRLATAVQSLNSQINSIDRQLAPVR